LSAELTATKPEEAAATIYSSQLVSSNSLPYLFRGASECSNEDAQNKTELIVDADEEVYNMDQSDERRFYSLREGKCFVETTLSSKGVFWIKPITEAFNDFNQKTLSDRIQKVINVKRLGPFSSNKQHRPAINSKCFVYVCNSKSNTDPRYSWLFKRGHIEYVDYGSQRCDIRLLDKGSRENIPFRNIFPHARLDAQLYTKDKTNNILFRTPNYMGIRCCISANEVSASNLQKNIFFESIFPGHSRFELIEQVQIGDLKCWYTKIYLGDKNKQHEGKCLNSMLLESTEQELIEIEKTLDTKERRNKKADSLLVNASTKVDATTTYSSLPANATNDLKKSRNSLGNIDPTSMTGAEAKETSFSSKSKSKRKSSRKKKKEGDTPDQHLSRDMDAERKRANSLIDKNQSNQYAAAIEQQQANFSISNNSSASHVSSLNNLNNDIGRFHQNSNMQPKQMDNFKYINQLIQSNLLPRCRFIL